MSTDLICLLGVCEWLNCCYKIKKVIVDNHLTLWEDKFFLHWAKKLKLISVRSGILNYSLIILQDQANYKAFKSHLSKCENDHELGGSSDSRL